VGVLLFAGRLFFPKEKTAEAVFSQVNWESDENVVCDAPG
jgi:hypothetical protein